MRWLYELIQHLLLLPLLAKLLYERIFHGKYRSSLKGLFGRGVAGVEKGGRPLIWIHAVSLGETKVAGALIRELKAHPSSPLILLTSHTETGFQEGERVKGVDYHHYLPFDFSYFIRPFVRKHRPDLLILIEADFWFNMLDEVKGLGGRIALVNGKLSEKSFKRFKMISPFSKRLFGLIDLFALQTEGYRDRFIELGVDPKKIVVTGNLKLDGMREMKSRQELRDLYGFSVSDLILTLGSTHDPEEDLFLDRLEELWPLFPGLHLILAPRHPERFETILRKVQERGLSYRRLSEGPPFTDSKILLVDAMGQLLTFYALSDLAFVGGSFTPKVGGHNIIEPSFFGLPVLFGPHMHSQPGFSKLVLEAGAGLEITEEEIIPALKALLSDKQKRAEMGARGLKMVKEASGALRRTEGLLNPLVGKGPLA